MTFVWYWNCLIRNCIYNTFHPLFIIPINVLTIVCTTLRLLPSVYICVWVSGSRWVWVWVFILAAFAISQCRKSVFLTFIFRRKARILHEKWHNKTGVYMGVHFFNITIAYPLGVDRNISVIVIIILLIIRVAEE